MSAASIKALPSSTVQLIGSSQVLLDASSVVKELVENAIDARATSISIDLSANTLNTIQVRDNGHGIAPDDRGRVCKRYTTSKISDFADVRDLGGTWLGFRGEALHSLAEMSGAVSIVTRVEGETTAVKLNIGPGGDVDGRSVASHPVGTTVRAIDFLGNFPVRKQTALNAIPKCMAKIKRLLQSYALAKPAIRISMKVLKAKSEKDNFLYAPNTAAATVEDAAYKVFGKDCASQCEWSVLDSHDFQLQAFLPTANADATKISHIGPFLSIDARPVSNARGISKQIVTLYKGKLRASSPEIGCAKYPFLYLNIACPKGSYDPNVEPAKDDVIFDDGKRVIAAVKELLAVVYPDQESPPVSLALPVQEAGVASSRNDTDMLNSVPHPLIEYDESTLPEHDESTWMASMFHSEGADMDMLLTADGGLARSLSRASEPPSLVERDVELSNPWTIARMNAPVRSTAVQSSNIAEDDSYLTPLRSRQDGDPDVSSTGLQSFSQEPNASPRRMWQPLSLNQFTPINRSMFTPIDGPDSSHYGLPTPNPSSSPIRGTALSTIPEAPRRRKQSHVRPNADVSAPNVCSSNESNWFDFRESSGSTRRTKPRGLKVRADRDIREVFGSSQRRSAVQRALVVPGIPEVSIQTPDTAAAPVAPSIGIETLHEPSNPGHAHLPEAETALVNVPTQQEPLPPPSRRRRTTEARRTKSCRLPLERVPAGSELHNLSLLLPITLSSICNGMLKLERNANFAGWYDVAEGRSAFSAMPSAVEMQRWSERIARALSAVSETDAAGEQEEVETRICAVLGQVEWL